jgi:hypothetical protein
LRLGLAGSYCHPLTSVCTAYPGAGSPCQTDRWCAAGLYCELQDLVCKAPPGLGAPCGVDAPSGLAALCADGLLCNRVSKAVGTCQKPPAVGKPCIVDPETQRPILNSCGLDEYCNTSVAPALCAAPAGPGKPCYSTPDDNACQSGLLCACPGFGNDCDQPMCLAMRFGQQRCDEPGTACHPGFSCTEGVCVARDSQGKFEQICAP